VVLVTCGVVRRDRAVLAEVGWGLVVADEVQHAKNPLSRTARELRAIPAPARVALTGTPVENRLTELWSILDWTTPGLLGPLERFRRSVAVPVERYRDADATERLTRVVRPFLLRRRKSDPRIAPELPAKTETDRVVPLTAEQATLSEAVVRETLADRPVQVHRLVTEARLRTTSPRCWRPSVTLPRRSSARAKRGSPSCPTWTWRSLSPCRGRREKQAAGGSPAGRRAAAAPWLRHDLVGGCLGDALEQRARLDPNRLPRGHGYARGGTVGELAIAPGEVRATVQGRRARPYQVRVRVRVLEAEEWDRVLDAIAAQIGHAAALLDGELLPEVANDVRSAGTDLLPGPGELQRAAPAPTGRTRASTPRRSATWWRVRWTPTRSRCCCYVAAGATKCWPGCVPAAAPPR
jgi:hypothetical protein